MIKEQYKKELSKKKTLAEGAWFSVDVLNTPITQKENMIRFLKHDHPMFQVKDSDNVGFTPRLIPENTARALVMDAEFDTPYTKGGKDFFDITWDYVDAVGGSMVRPGKPKVPDICEWEKYITFPDLSAYDWEASAAANKEYLDPDMPVYIWIMNGLFERLISFMEFEDAAVALIDEDEKEAVHRLFDRLCVFYDELLDYYKKYYDATIVCFHDDWGSQKSSFFSKEVCDEMLVPYLKRIFASIHEKGMFVDFHSCGKHENLTPCMIEAKADVWYPQPMNDFDLLYKEYGNDIILGLPLFTENDTEEEAIRVAQEFMDKYGKNKNVIPYAGYDPLNEERQCNPKVFDYIYALSRDVYAE